MKRAHWKISALLATAVAMTIGGTAMAQLSTSDQQVMPNGNVHSTTRAETPNGSASTTRVDRPDGSTRIIHRQTDVMGDTRVTSHERGSDDGRDVRDDNRMGMHNGDMRGRHMGWNNRRVCNTRWHNGMRQRHCWMSHRSW